MLSFFAVIAVLYVLYHAVITGYDLFRNKDKPSSGSVNTVHVDFSVKRQPVNVVADMLAAADHSSGEGEKNQAEKQPEKENPQDGEEEGLMDAEELQAFLNDLNIEFVKPDFSLAKPVNEENIYEDALPVS